MRCGPPRAMLDRQRQLGLAFTQSISVLVFGLGLS